MRLLPERPDPHRRRAPPPQSAPDRRRDSPGHGRRALSVHDVLPRPGRGPPRGEGGRMNATRREFLQTSGALVVSLSATRMAGPLDVFAEASGPYPDPDYRQLDSWI